MKSSVAIRVGLMLMSMAAGCLDILCYHYLGEVFPSAMTGNLALLGQSLGGFDVPAALRHICAFGGFFGGVLIGAGLLRGTPGRARFVGTLGLQAAVLLGLALAWNGQALGALRFELIAAAAIGMGLQSAVAHRIGVHAVSTTYFTGTTANIAFGLIAPPTPKPPFGQRVGWPVVALLSYLAGAALAGLSIAQSGFPALPIGLEALPCITTVILAILVAVKHRPA